MGTAATRNRRIARGGLHHGEIDTHLSQCRINLAKHGRPIGPVPCRGDAGQPGGGVRLVGAEALQERLGPPDEHAAVPEVTLRAGGKVACRRRLVRLLLESLDDSGGCAQRLAKFQVAVTSGGLVGAMPKVTSVSGCFSARSKPWAMIA